jgi:creatinine amidohydrolase
MTMITRLSWDEAESRLETCPATILPIGAAAKEHGLHLPLDTDEIQAVWLARRLAEATGALVWPPVTYGHYPAFTDFPGSTSLSRGTFIALLRDIIGSIRRHSAKPLFILDTGISTIAPTAEAIAGMPAVIHLQVHDGPRYRATARSLGQQKFGSHADELETSRMLVIAPVRVRMDRARATPQGPIEGPLTRTRAPSGSYGDPTLASAEKGKALLDAMLDDLLGIMEKVMIAP